MTDTPTSSIGYGQQDPFSATSDFAVIAFVARQLMNRLDIMKLVKVTKVTGGGATLGAAGTVDVELLVNQIDSAGNAVASGTVYGLPYFRLQGGKNAVIMEPKVDDIGFVICADRDISAVKSSKKKSTPGSFRKFSVSDGVYIGGILNGTPEQAVIFGDDFIKVVDKTGNVVEMKSTGIELTPSGVLPVKVNGNLVVTGNLLLGGNIRANPDGTYAGNIVTSGQVTAAGIGLTTHHHTQPADSRGDTEQPTGSAVA